jgi:hypothetical protein
LRGEPSQSVDRLAAALTCPNEFVTFHNADGVTGHCEMTGRSQFHRRVYDWLDGVLATTPGVEAAR